MEHICRMGDTYIAYSPFVQITRSPNILDYLDRWLQF